VTSEEKQIYMSDIDEFMDLAQGDSLSLMKQERAKSGRRTINNMPEWDDGDDEDEAPDGTLCQYSRSGSGFQATSATVEKLPPAIYKLIATNSGLVFDTHNVVTDNLLRLPDSKSDQVIAEIENFWKKGEIFKKFGFSHKRGFLLWGPPGSGKTCTIAFVMQQMVKDGGVVFLGDCGPGLLGTGIKQFRTIEKERPVVVVLEDIDTLIQQYGESEVLSILDGESSISNVVFLATTNYPENLDGRVVNRPSRFDRVVKIGMPNKDARLAYLKSRNLGVDESELVKWADLTDGFSIAHLKEVVVGVMCFGNVLEEEIKRLKAMAKAPKSGDFGKQTGFGRGEDY
jgi:SpoVK/Ycf46/Vps4 family AAA+-type ATPase